MRARTASAAPFPERNLRPSTRSFYLKLLGYARMDAYIGLETGPGFQDGVYRALKARGIEAYLTLGAHDIICKLPSFTNLQEFRGLIDSILFTTDRNRALVENTTSYLILEQHRKKGTEKPTAFCFVRSGRHTSREKFDRTVTDVSRIRSVIAASVVIGLFDLVCEVVTKDIAELKTTVDKILATPGVSPRAIMACIVVGPGAARSRSTGTQKAA